MKTILIPLLATLSGLLRSRVILHLEILALRQQLAMATHKDRKLRFRWRERLFVAVRNHKFSGPQTSLSLPKTQSGVDSRVGRGSGVWVFLTSPFKVTTSTLSDCVWAQKPGEPR